mgnify:CR=1 FL=1
MSTFPGVGDAIPDIAMETPEGGTVKPSDFAGSKLVIFFYPKDDTPGCTTENKDFSALKADFEAAGTKLLGVSKDPAKKHAKFIAKHGLTAPLATDAEEGGLSDALGVWAEKQMYGKTVTGVIRSTFVIDADGVIAHALYNVKATGHVARVRSLLGV